MLQTVFTVVILALSTQWSNGQLWCNYDPTSTPFHEAMAHLGVPGPKIPAAEIENLAEQLFQKFNCAERGPYCECFPQEDIRRLLEMGDELEFDEEHFNRACVMLIETARDLEHYCPRIANDTQLTYGSFEHVLTTCPGCHDDHDEDDGHPHSGNSLQPQQTDDDDDHGHGFTWTQLDQYSHVLNNSYIPGDCSGNFTAESVFRALPLHDPGHGEITEEEVPVMSAALVVRFTKGECLFHSHWHVEAEDFMLSLFHQYANDSTCKIHKEGLDHFLHDLAIAEHSEGVDDPHDHSASSGRIFNLWKWWDSDVTVGTMDHHTDEDDHDHDHGSHEVPINASVNCYSTDLLLEAYGIDIEAGMDTDQMREISHALVQQAAVGCQHSHEEDDQPGSDKLTTAEMYGYGTLAVLVESLCALLGLIIVKWRKTAAYKYILVVMLGLSVGTMCGDAILHLIPVALGLHSHDDGHNHSHEGVYVEEYTWKMMTMMSAIWVFFMLQLGMEAFHARKAETDDNIMEMKFTEKSDGIENFAYNGDVVENGKVGGGSVEAKTANGIPNGTPQRKPKGHGHSHLPDDDLDDDDVAVKAPAAMPFMLLLGDSLHNFADGMTIGAAFTTGWRTGLSTTIAVFCHELPHEFGDIAAVLSAGWSPLRALLVNGCSALCAFVGLYIGIPVATALDADAWLLSLAAGMFIYISLADIVPELVEFFRVYDKTRMFIAANFGFGLGFLIMMLIAVFEDQIAV